MCHASFFRIQLPKLKPVNLSKNNLRKTFPNVKMKHVNVLVCLDFPEEKKKSALLESAVCPLCTMPNCVHHLFTLLSMM